MTVANCGIILSGHFNAKILTTLPWGRGKGKVSSQTLRPKYYCYVLETSCACYNSHFLSK